MDNLQYQTGRVTAYTEVLRELETILDHVDECDCGNTSKHDGIKECCFMVGDLLTDKLADILASALVAIVSAQDDSSDAS